MSDKYIKEDNMEGVLNILEDHSIAYLMRTENYKKIDNNITEHGLLPTSQMKQLLQVFTHDLNEDTKYAVNILKMLSTILKKIEAQDTALTSELLPTATAIMGILSKTAPLHKVQSLQHLCLDVLLAYPDAVYVILGTNHRKDVLALTDQYMSNNSVEWDIKILVLDIIMKVLKVLQPDNRKIIVEDGLSVWFSRIVPSFITSAALREQCLNIMDIIIKDLTSINYYEHPQWNTLFKNISTVDKYPAAIKSLLTSGDTSWHLAWCCIVKLLGTKLHKSANLINSLLSVLESAFKMSTEERCRAFFCWNVLIENFSLNMEQFFTNRRIKLLLIPLVVNNAKEEKSGVYKFNSWWLLLKLLQPKIDQYMDSIIVPFLQFCFGNVKPKEGCDRIVPGLAFPKVKILAVDALLEMVGHNNCDGCVSDSMEKLPGRLMNSKNITSHAANWILALKEATVLIAAVKEKNAEQNIKCLYWSVLRNIEAITDRSNQEIVYMDFLKMLSHLVEKCEGNKKLANLIFTVLGPFLINDKSGVTQLDGKFRGCGNISMEYIFKLMLCPTLNVLYSPEDPISVQKLKVFTDVGVNTSPDGYVNWLLQELPTDEEHVSHSLAWWCSLAKSLIQYSCQVNDKVAKDMLIWPITKVEFFTEVKFTAETWLDLYTEINKNLDTNLPLHSDLLNITMLHYKESSVHNLFLTFVLPATIRSILDIDPKKIESLDTELKMMCKMFESIGERSDNYGKKVLQTIASCLGSAFNALSVNKNNEAVLDNVTAAINTFFTMGILSSKTSKGEKEELILKLLYAISNTIENDNTLCLSVKKFLLDCATLDIATVKNISQNILKNFKSDKNISLQNVTVNLTPVSKKIDKKSKSTGKIVKKISDGNEEFVVIKSNWKFNPNKLTEHQKEVLKKKREDIPALYQDLSQSQDEVKIKSWKAPDYKSDSQDISTSASNSMNVADSSSVPVFNILKDIPNREICPNVVSSLFKNDNTEILKKSNTKENSTLNGAIPVSPKSGHKIFTAKSPRMSLKDKIQKNVLNLLHSPQNLSPVQRTQNVSNLQTPSSVQTEITVSTPASPKQDSDRPSRTRRKPKKLENDFEIEIIKRKRTSIDVDPKISSLNNKEDIIDLVHDEKYVSSNEQVEEQSHKEQLKLSTEGDTSNNELQQEVVTNVTIDCVGLQTFIESDSKKTDNTPTHSVKYGEIKTPQSRKKSRLHSQLAIDMVEGHPLLTATPEEKRSTRKARSLNDNNKLYETPKKENIPVTKLASPLLCEDLAKDHHERLKDNVKANTPSKVITQMIELPHSEDFIESSQESPVSTPQLTVKSSRRSSKISEKKRKKNVDTHSSSTSECESDGRSSSGSPVEEVIMDEALVNSNLIDQGIDEKLTNNTKHVDAMSDLTVAGLDTQLVSTDVTAENKQCNKENINIVLDNDDSLVTTTNINKNLSDKTIAEMDTEPIPSTIIGDQIGRNEPVLTDNNSCDTYTIPTINLDSDSEMLIEPENKNVPTVPTNVRTVEIDSHKEYIPLHDILIPDLENTLPSSPFKDNKDRNNDFLNNTYDISPIKVASPLPRPPSPQVIEENSNDYVVIQLSSPVRSNGEPIDKCPSPEIFTNDKISPEKVEISPEKAEVSPEKTEITLDKVDISPPRGVTVSSTGSPTSLSLKKNRSQVKPSGRGAQMLVLCHPIGFIKSNSSSDSDITDDKAVTPARKNLRNIYGNCIESDILPSEITNHVDNFLSLTKELPSATSSPTGPILKRKHSEIGDDVTQSPASKRKRVSFHDPPVSTTVSIHKYIEDTTRSPQKARKLERRCKLTSSKKKLQMVQTDNAEVMSSDDSSAISNSETEMLNEGMETDSLEDTPAAVIVEKDLLTNTQPIYFELADCPDSIACIVGDLTTESMKNIFLKELTDIKTIGDLAKLSELEVNRLNINTPKIETARKALAKYHKFITTKQTTKEVVMNSIEIQTEFEEEYFWTTLKDRSTKEVIKACLEKDDFIQELTSAVDSDTKQKIVAELPVGTVGDILCERLNGVDSVQCDEIFTSLVQKHPLQFLDKTVTETGLHKVGDKLGLDNIQEYLLANLSAGELVKFCSTILQKKIP